jgi:hypothetical protein
MPDYKWFIWLKQLCIYVTILEDKGGPRTVIQQQLLPWSDVSCGQNEDETSIWVLWFFVGIELLHGALVDLQGAIRSTEPYAGK